MAGPQVRGDIKISRNAQVKKVRQGLLTFVPNTDNPTLTLVSGDPYTIIVNASSPIMATTVTLPQVATGSSIPANPNNATVVNTPRGPESGVGTEFRIVNNSGADLPVRDSSPSNIVTIPSGNTSVVYCDDASTAPIGLWKNYIVDAATAQLTPRNIAFDGTVGTIASGDITITGTASTVMGTITVSFTRTSGEVYSVTTANLPTGTTPAGTSNMNFTDGAAFAIVQALNNDRTFPEFYIASVSPEGSAVISVEALDTGSTYNAGDFTITTPAGLGASSNKVDGGGGGSWRAGTSTDGSDVFEFRIAQVRHQRGLDPVYQVFEDVTNSNGILLRSRVLIDSNANSATGELVIQVNTAPIGIFAGSVDVL